MPVSDGGVVPVVVAGARLEGIAILQFLVAMTRSVLVTKLLTFFVVEESVAMIFRLLQSRLRSGRPCVCVEDEVVAGVADPDWRPLNNLM